MRSAVTISLVPEARGGPFIFSGDLEAACSSAGELGFDAIEIFPRAPDQCNRPSLESILKRYNLDLAAAGSGAGWAAHKLSLTDPDAGKRREARKFIEGVIDFAADLGAPTIVGSMQGRWQTPVSRDQALSWLREGIEELAQTAERRQVRLLLEPLNRYETNLLNRVADSLAFLETVNAPNVKLLCDLFHMNIEERDIADSLRQARLHLGHLHFVDSNRQAVGWGHTDIGPIVAALQEIGYDGYISGEALPVPDSLSAARQTIASFRRWFGKGSKC